MRTRTNRCLLFMVISIRLNYTEKAVVSARAARKKRWLCFGLLLIIIAIIVIIVVVEVLKNQPAKKN